VDSGDVYVVESGFITTGEFVWKKFKTITQEHFETIDRSSCKGGDIIIAKIGARYGMAAILPELDRPAVVSGNSLKLSVDRALYDHSYIHLALLCARARGALFPLANATAQPALSLRALNVLALPHPPLSEQRQIVSRVSDRTMEVNSALRNASRQIGLLREYRTCLITDVVTGKLDVRGMDLPEMENAEEVGSLSDVADDVEDSEELDPAESIDAD
jgi:type I restriction enzyme, S subunit